MSGAATAMTESIRARRRARLFRHADLKRAVRAAVDAGLDVGQVEIVAATGNIVIKARRPGEPAGRDELDEELAAFEARHGNG